MRYRVAPTLFLCIAAATVAAGGAQAQTSSGTLQVSARLIDLTPQRHALAGARQLALSWNAPDGPRSADSILFRVDLVPGPGMRAAISSTAEAGVSSMNGGRWATPRQALGREPDLPGSPPSGPPGRLRVRISYYAN